MPDGRYKYRYTDETGARRTVYSWKLVETDKLKEGQTGKKSLREKEKEIQRDLDDHIKTRKAERTTLCDMFDRFMAIRLDLREATRCCYRDLFNSHVRPFIGERPLSSIKSTDIQKMYQEASIVRGVRPSTVQKIHSVVYQLFDIAVSDDIIRHNPASKAFKYFAKTNDIEPKRRDALTAEQQARFIDFVYSSRIYARLGNLFTLLLGTGVRIGEALALTDVDFDFEEDLIDIYKTLAYKAGENGKYRYMITPPKTASGNREVPMMDDVKAAVLREMKKPRPKKRFEVDGYKNFIFVNSSGQVYTNAYIYDAIQGIVETYNREELAKAKKELRDPVFLPKFSAHTLRHTFCTRMCEEGADMKSVQEIMGHRDIRTTMDVYVTATRDKKRDVIKQMNGRMKIA